MSSIIQANINQIENIARFDKDEALMQASSLIELHLDIAEVWSLRAYIYAKQRKWAQAIDDVTHAINIAPTEPVLFYDRGRYFIKIEGYIDAIHDFSEGIKFCYLCSNDYYLESLYFHRAFCYLKLKHIENSINDLSYVRDDYSTWVNGSLSKQELLVQCGKGL